MLMLECLCCGRVKVLDETEDDPKIIAILTICPKCKERLGELVREVNRVQAERN